MDYFCGYYPKQKRKSEQRENSAQGQASASGEAGASLLVQHCEYPQGQVLLACMGLSLQEENAEHGPVMEALFQWFRGLAIRRRDWKDQDRAVVRWKGELEALFLQEFCEGDEKNSQVALSISGLFCFGQKAILFRMGELEIFKIQEDIGRMYLRALPLDDRQFQSGVAIEVVETQPNVGVMIVPHEFAKHITNIKLGECLKMRTIMSEEQLQKQLEELLHVAGGAAIIVKIGGAGCDGRLA